MNAGAGDTHAVLEGLTLRIKAWKRRQQRRMDVQDPVFERVQYRAAHNPHVASQTHEASVTGLQKVRDRPIARVSIGIVLRRNTHRLDAGRAGALKPWSVAAVRDDNRDRSVQRTTGNRIDDRLEIAATTRDENRDAAIEGGH